MPSFPRRRESCLIFKNYCKNKLLFEFNQDSRLRGNDGTFTISCRVLGFAKVSMLAASRRRSILGFRLPIFSGCLLISRASAAAATSALFVFRLPCGIVGFIGFFAAQRIQIQFCQQGAVAAFFGVRRCEQGVAVENRICARHKTHCLHGFGHIGAPCG